MKQVEHTETTAKTQMAAVSNGRKQKREKAAKRADEPRSAQRLNEERILETDWSMAEAPTNGGMK